MKRQSKNRSGFSLIEMAVVVVLLGILVGFSFQFLTSGIDAYLVGRDYTDVSQQGKIALERMAREARFALQTTVTIGTSSITFTKYTGSPNDASKVVTFSVVPGETMLRRTGTATYDLADNVQNFTPAFDAVYFLITLDLTLTRGEGSVRYRTKIHPRN